MNALEFSDFSFSEAAYFFQISGGESLGEEFLNKLFKTVMIESETIDPVPLFHDLIEENNTKIGGIVFRRKRTPTFLTSESGHFENIYSYLFIIEYDGFVALTKRNIKGLEEAIEPTLIRLPYDVISKSLLNQDSIFKKLDMQNTDTSNESFRTKTLIAADLSKLQSSSANFRYAVRNFEIQNESTQFVVSFRTSKIAEKSSKVPLAELSEWIKIIVDEFKDLYRGSTILDTFAQPMPFNRRPKNIRPTSIHFLRGAIDSKLTDPNDPFWIATKSRGPKYIKGNQNIIDKIFERNLPLRPINEGDKRNFSILNELNRKFMDDPDFSISLLKTKVKIKSKVLSKIYLMQGNEPVLSLEKYLNESQEFIILFDNPEYSYIDSQIFQRNFIKSSLKVIGPILLGFNEMKEVTSEKGDVTENSSNFSPDSAFHFIEQIMSQRDRITHLFCDDLGHEWADFVGYSSEHLAFYHAKAIHTEPGASSTSLSASKFHDLFSQVTKNIGNLKHPTMSIDEKLKKWNKNFNLNNVTSQIKRNRKNSPIKDAQTDYNSLKINSNQVLTVYAVVNFLSKKEYLEALSNLAKGVENRAQVHQLTWMIAQLLSLCKEQGIRFFIACQE